MLYMLSMMYTVYMGCTIMRRMMYMLHMTKKACKRACIRLRCILCSFSYLMNSTHTMSKMYDVDAVYNVYDVYDVNPTCE